MAEEIIYVRKASGELELFSEEKLKNSLVRSGAGELVIGQIMEDVKSWIYDGIPSKKIYTGALAQLRKLTLGNAARYKLKNAMMEMGPTGHPFEFFASQIFKIMGYDVEVAQIVQGHCVTHEVDVVATKGKKQNFVECKYYQKTGKNANVQVSLYIRSRVDDIVRKRREIKAYNDYEFDGWIVTNTRFTADAISFGECTGLHLLGWDYPRGNGLREIIDREHIFPITTLTRLSIQEKQKLMEKGIVICRQITEKPSVLSGIGMDHKKQQKVIEEIKFLCAMF